MRANKLETAAVQGPLACLTPPFFMHQSDSSDGGWISILGAVQRLVEELTVLLSSLDQGNTTQLPQQVLITHAPIILMELLVLCPCTHLYMYMYM